MDVLILVNLIETLGKLTENLTTQFLREFSLVRNENFSEICITEFKNNISILFTHK